MNFFKSILSEDPDPPKPESPHGSDPNSPLKPSSDDDDSDSNGAAAGWSFGGLMKNLAIESVIETYRKDLQEFGSGLKKETEILRDTASRAVKDLPASIEASASAAQGAFDGVLKSTAEIISKESLGFASDGEPETPGTNRSRNSGRYSWFDTQLGAIQGDSTTFCEDPEDLEEYRKWKLGFELERNRGEINVLIGEDGILEEVHKRLVPNSVDQETFWSRYFYRVDKLKQQESVRANLVKRAISNDDDEDLSWDVEDDEDNDDESESRPIVKGGDDVTDGNSKALEKQDASESQPVVKGEEGAGDTIAIDGISKAVEKQDETESSQIVEGGDSERDNIESDGNSKAVEKQGESRENSEKEVKAEAVEEVKRDDEKVSVEEKGEPVKKSDSSVVAEEGEEELGWDEIGDTGSGDEKKVPTKAESGSPRKRSSGVEDDDDDDDLSWDIDDDDDDDKPMVKA